MSERELDGANGRETRISNGCAAEEGQDSRSTEMSSLSENTTANRPRSRRVHGPGLPEDFRLSTSTTSSSSCSRFPPPSPHTTSSPPIPPRSPLRPSAKAARGPTTSTSPQRLSNASDNMPLLHSRSLGSISGLLDQPAALSRRPTTPDKPLPLTPQPSTSMSLSAEPEEDDDETLIPSMSSTSTRTSMTAVLTKREHVLQELLNSERSYASDLALIRDIHIPLALGQPAPFSATPATPPGSSASSSRTLSTASDSSTASYLAGAGPPMSREDARIIFSNVAELAVFADEFSEALEDALGTVLEGGKGEDCVGKLFLAVIPTMQPLYQTYITKHATGAEHLAKLQQSPALQAYLAQAGALAAGLSHAWDLPSLLIKPVQRLLKYPLLLATIIEETPDSHEDKENLRLAREKMEQVARSVNEGRRRKEVVREVLQSGPVGTISPHKAGEAKAKKKGLNVGIAASVSLGRMKSLRTAALKAKEGAEANQEAEAVKQMGDFLKRYEDFMQRFAKETVQWVEAVRGLMCALDEWAKSFGRVIWMDAEPRSEAFDAFLTLISDQLIPICDESKAQITKQLLPDISALIETTTAPLRLLEAMHTLEPLHLGLLNLNISKSRPPPQLLEASQSYIALRAQLFVELPKYLALFDKGMSACILRFATTQQHFYNNVRERWGDLWDALKVDSEANQGAAETLRVWWSRFAEVELQIQGLNIVRPAEKRLIPEKLRLKAQMRHETTTAAAGSSMHVPLDPLSIRIPHPHPSPSSSSFGFTTATSPVPANTKARSVHSVEGANGAMSMSERKSLESLHSKKSGKSRRPSSSRGNSVVSSTLVDEPTFGYNVALPSSSPMYSRTQSMSLQPPTRALSVGRYLDIADESSPNSSNPSLNSVASTLQDDGRDLRGRGRPQRKASFRRRLTDSFRNTGLSDSMTPQPPTLTARQRRSPSLPPYSTTPSPSPNKATFAPSSGARRRPSGGVIPAMYQCRVIHPCEPPRGVSYRELLFFTLRVDDVYDILQEAGHPSTHRDLPLYVDDGEDCLLLARNEAGDVGWVLASFMLPVD